MDLKKKKKVEKEIPLDHPVTLWKVSGKAKPGPSDLQKRYFIDKYPPHLRPHWHTQDIVVSVGGFGSGKSYGAVARIVDTCISNPGTKAMLGGIDLQLLKRNVIGVIRDIFTVNKAWDHPAIENVLSDKQTILRFRNGSELTLVNLTEFLKVIGANVSIMLIEEPHILPDGEQGYEALVSRLRQSPPDIRQMILCTNPEKSKEGWMNTTFEMSVFDGVDTSAGPVEKSVGKPCECQICLRCNISYGKHYTWVRGFIQSGALIPDESSTDYYCPNCQTVKDFWTWEGKKYHCPGNQKYIRVIKSESMHNPHLPDDVLQTMKNQYDETTFNIMVKGQLNTNLRDDNYLYPSFTEEDHELKKEIPIDFGKDIYWSCDFNLKPMCSVVAQYETIHGKDAFVFKDEIILYGPPTEVNPYGDGGAKAQDVAEEFVRRYKSYYREGTIVYLYGDPKAFGGVTDREENNFEILMRILEENDFDVRLMMTKNQIGVKNRISLMNYRLKNGKPLLRFNPEWKMRWTIPSFRECKWAEKNNRGNLVDKRQDENAAKSLNKKRIYAVTHLNEAAGYMLYKLHPLISEGGTRSAVLPDGTVIEEDVTGRAVIRRPDSEDDEKDYLSQKEMQELAREEQYKKDMDRLNNPGKYGGLNMLLGGALPRRKNTSEIQ